MRLSIITALALMLLASGALAFGGPGSVVVDIVGSKTENTKIVASGPEKVELEIIGSTAINTTITPHAEKAKICPDSWYCVDCPPCYPNPCSDAKCDKQQKPYPWKNRHFGVDAWYGAFWYADQPNMPKWPQI